MLKDLRYALRQLLKSPAFAVVAILTIGLGIGANTAVFNVVNTVLLRSLPVPEPQRLVLLHLKNQPLNTSQSGYDDTSLPLPVIAAMRTRHDVFQDVVAFAPLSFGKVTVRYGREPEQAHGEAVSGNYFAGLGVRLAMGRGFTAQDEKSSAPVAVLSYRWWRGRFNASPDILGKTLSVKGVAVTIVGVAAAGFEGSDPGNPEMDFWIPLQRNPALNVWGQAAEGVQSSYASPRWLCLMAIGRLRPGVSADRAIEPLQPLFRRVLAEAAPVDARERKRELAFSDVRGIGTLRDEYQRPLRLLMAMVGLVLLIASANVAMLLVLRNAVKEREFALRRALGAGAGALFGQLLAESFLLVAAGGLVAWWLAGAATQALTRWSGLEFAILPDQRVLLFTLATAAAVTFLFGLAPMRMATGAPLALTLRSAAAGGGGDRRRPWGRQLVVALQIAMCVVLLFAGQLLYGTLRNLEATNLGLRTAGLLVFGISPQANIKTEAEAIQLHLRILRDLRALPGVDHATVTAVRLGVGGSNNDGVLVDGRNPLPGKPYAPAHVNEVGSDFLRTFGIPLVSGRDFGEADIGGSAKVAIVNQTFADRYLLRMNPLEHQIANFAHPERRFRIVGVARNSRYTGVRELDHPTVYVPFTQVPGVSAMQYELHTMGDPKAAWPEVTRVVRAIDPNLPLEGAMTQRKQFEQSISQERLVARLSICFAALAMFLVAIGLYGAISYSVGRRTTEIGLRMALGAQRRQVLGMVLRESAWLALLGFAIGLPVALGLAHLMRSMLYGLGPANPEAYAVTLAGVVLVSAGATFFPARRAATIDPLRALRAE